MTNKFAFYIILALLAMACQKEKELDENILSDYFELSDYKEQNEVIACSGNSKDDASLVNTFFYPLPTASDFRLYVTSSLDVDPNDYSNYRRKVVDNFPVMNGYLRYFQEADVSERYVLVTYNYNGNLHASNPIRLKNTTKQTDWYKGATISPQSNNQVKFCWDDKSVTDNEIYFQIISDEQSNLLSGTYTYEKCFTYYDTGNVVLNVTWDEPPALQSGNKYNFTMMAVSKDNWINQVIMNSFLLP